MKRLLPLACLALTAAGCVEGGPGRYPSLLPREIEKRGDAEPETPIAIADPDPALDRALTGQAKMLDDTQAAFAPAADRAEAAAKGARGDAVGSERWIAAQTALAELDTYRATTSATVTDIEQVALNRAAEGKPPYPSVDALKTRGEALLDGQSARIAAIQAMLPGS
ncbi:hypothetical protein [Sphingomonas immobilis]|uniref:DUF4142 domain-containing protein n=1 Tax=Sphingomonas immobilis TaxID=3063997 RepID=A0ABT9A0C9_9SPHN|nr:hypothetical protein [Sphingomonas sp. CA1-15]MDO7842988.1 hypothetical protein [Sphingomonas sp. CA1-15]